VFFIFYFFFFYIKIVETAHIRGVGHSWRSKIGANACKTKAKAYNKPLHNEGGSGGVSALAASGGGSRLEFFIFLFSKLLILLEKFFLFSHLDPFLPRLEIPIFLACGASIFKAKKTTRMNRMKLPPPERGLENPAPT